MYLRDPIMVRLTSSELIKNTTLVSFGYLSVPSHFPLF